MGDLGSAISTPFRRLVWAIPAAFVLHVVEEAASGFNVWASQVLGGAIDPTVFALANVGFMAMALGLTAWASFTGAPQAVFMLLAWASAHLFWDALFHIGMTVTMRRYSPGLITGALIYFPLSLIIAAAALRQGVIGPKALFAAVVLGGVLLSAILLTGHAIH